MRRLLLFLLIVLLSVAVFAATKPNDLKILVPVVVNPGGQPVLTLQTSDFSVEGSHSHLDAVRMVPAEAMNDAQHTFPVFILYDAYLFSAPVQSTVGNDLLQFLTGVAQQHSPVTVVANTAQGLKLIYDFGTDHKILADALTALNQGAKVTDDKVKQQVERLRLLKTFVPAPTAAESLTMVQMAGLDQMSQVLKRSPNRKALLWLTWKYWLGTGEFTRNWMLSAQSQEVPTGLAASALGAAQADTRYANLPPLYEKAVQALNQAHVSVYPLQQYDRRVTNLSFNNREEWFTIEGLKQVAACTGGFSFKDFKQTSVAQAVAAIWADFGPYYMLTVGVDDVKRIDWIPLKIKVNNPALTIRTAPGFLGLTSAAAKSSGLSGD